MDRSRWVGGENQGLFRQRDWGREVTGYLEGIEGGCVYRSDKEQQYSRESWKEAGNEAETRIASEDVDTVAGYRG